MRCADRINPEVMANNYENVLSVVGDAKLVLANLFAAVPAKFEGAVYQPWIDHLNALRANIESPRGSGECFVQHLGCFFKLVVLLAERILLFVCRRGSGTDA